MACIPRPSSADQASPEESQREPEGVPEFKRGEQREDDEQVKPVQGEDDGQQLQDEEADAALDDELDDEKARA